ncbi:MAG: hypothetical protein KJ063_00180 [Anaerolineae bacterium]|nr:hypothetical protein [Anaerolineae bacterium]
MIGNLVLLVGISLLLWLAWRYGFGPSRSSWEYQLLSGFALLSTSFLAFNGLLALVGYRSLHAAATVDPIRSTSLLAEKRSGDPVVIIGQVSQDNPRQGQEFVAYYDCDEDGCFPYLPLEMLIRVDGGNVTIGNNDYEAREWPVQGDVVYLAAGQPVVVVGTALRGRALTGEMAGTETVSVQAEIVFAGAHDAFIARARGRQWQPLLLIGLNGVAAAFALWLSYTLLRQSRDTAQNLPTDLPD